MERRRMCIVSAAMALTAALPASAAVGAPPPAKSADVQVTPPSISPDRATVGTTVTAAWTVSNAGPAPATSVAFSHAVPAGLEVTDAAASVGSCAVGSAVRCELGELGSSSDAWVTVSYRATVAGTRELTAEVSAQPRDPSPDNNWSSGTLAVTDSAPMPVGCSASASLPCAVPFSLHEPASIRTSLHPTATSAGELTVTLTGSSNIEWRSQVVGGAVVGGADRVFALEAGEWTLTLQVGDVKAMPMTVPRSTPSGEIRIPFTCMQPVSCLDVPLIGVPIPVVGGTQTPAVRSATGSATVTAQPA